MLNPTKYTSKIFLMVLVCTLASLCLASVVSAQSTVVNAEASSSQPHVGDTLTVNIKISGVQNLFGVDVTLSWNPAVLTVVSATSQLGVESHPTGVLHETATYAIEVVDDSSSQSTGEYHLLATSTGTVSSFSGSGTIATVTFTVTSAGATGLALQTELSDKPASGGDSNLIDHTDTADSVTAVSTGSSSTPTAITSGTPEPSPTIPEFSSIALVIIIVFFATATLGVISIKLKHRNTAFIK